MVNANGSFQPSRYQTSLLSTSSLAVTTMMMMMAITPNLTLSVALSSSYSSPIASDAENTRTTTSTRCLYLAKETVDLAIDCSRAVPDASTSAASLTANNAQPKTPSVENILKLSNVTDDIVNLQIRGMTLSKFKISDVLSVQYFHNLKRLDLSSNRISMLANVSNYTSAEFLVDDISIPDWESDLRINSNRDGLRAHPGAKLISLDLSKNRLKTIDENCFGDLGRLQVLDLSGNLLTVLSGRVLSRLASLIELKLHNNRLSLPLSGRFLKNCPLLELLDLNDNHVRSLAKEFFVENKNLKTLKLAGNLFLEFPKEAVSALTNLEYLDFSGNPTRRIESETLKSHGKLRELKINFMPDLEIIEAGAFYGLEKLEIILLNENKKLSYLDPLSFQMCGNVKELHLQNGRLATLSEELVEGFGKLQLLDLAGNPLECDCNLEWLIQLANNECRGRNNSEETRKAIAPPDLLWHSFQCPLWVGKLVSSRRLTCQAPPDLVGVKLCDLESTRTAGITLRSAKDGNDTYQNNDLFNSNINSLVESGLETESRLKNACPPIITPLFKRAVHLAIGQPLQLECRATGGEGPRPKTYWSFVGLGSRVHREDFDNLINGREKTVVSIAEINPHQAGLYTCTAMQYEGGKQTANVSVRVFNRNATVYATSLSRTSVTVEWTGTETTMKTADYYITCRRMIHPGVGFVSLESLGNRIRRHYGARFHPSALFAKRTKCLTSPSPSSKPLAQSGEASPLVISMLPWSRDNLSSSPHQQLLPSSGHSNQFSTSHSSHHHQLPSYVSGEGAALTYVKLKLGPFMRRNTFNGLLPMTPYQICISVSNSSDRRPTYQPHNQYRSRRRSPNLSSLSSSSLSNDDTSPSSPTSSSSPSVYEDDPNLIVLFCFQITTTDEYLSGFEREPGIKRIPILQILLGLFGSLAISLFLCAICRTLMANYTGTGRRKSRNVGDDYRLVACRSDRQDSFTLAPAETVFTDSTKASSQTSLLTR